VYEHGKNISQHLQAFLYFSIANKTLLHLLFTDSWCIFKINRMYKNEKSVDLKTKTTLLYIRSGYFSKRQ